MKKDVARRLSVRTIALVAALVIAAATGAAANSAPAPSDTTGKPQDTPERQQPESIIVDTDIAGDADDAGALAMMNALENRRVVRVLGVMAGSPSEWSAPAIDAINTYYGNGDIPIGTQRPPYLGHIHDMSTYRAVAENFPNDLRTGANAPESTALYRQLLAAQPDHSVTIVNIGLLTNLQRLLESGPDEHSRLNGYDLVARKVRLLSVMGGAYPDSGSVHPNGHEHNFDEHAEASASVVEQWPTRIVFAGWELGNAIHTGRLLLEQDSVDNPVREIYERFGFHSVDGRRSWDHVAMWYAACGTTDLFAEDGMSGSNSVSPSDGSNQWVAEPERDHSYLVTAAPNEAIAKTFEELMLQPARGTGGHPFECS